MDNIIEWISGIMKLITTAPNPDRMTNINTRGFVDIVHLCFLKQSTEQLKVNKEKAN
jgi:hypothetical protein